MNILHLRSSEFFGGPEKAIVGQCLTMRDCNFICASFVGQNSTNDFLERCASESLQTLALPQRSRFDLRPVALLRRAVLDHRIQILVSHDYKSNLLGGLALRGMSVVQVAHFRGRTIEDAKARFYNLVDRFVLRWMDHIFVVCQAAKDQLVRQGVDADRVSVVPNGYDGTSPMRSAAGASTDAGSPVAIIAAGRLSREKGFDILVAAAKHLERAGFDFHVRVYGSGPEEMRLKRQIAEAGMSRRISLSGFTDDLAARMREAKLLVIPSRSEGMPNVLLEAWASGLAVVATPVGGVPEMIDHQVDGLLSSDATPESLSAALAEALSRPEGLPAMARRGQEKLKNRFSFDRQAQLLGSLYSRLIQQARGSSDAVRESS